MIEDIKREIQRNVSVQTQLLKKIGIDKQKKKSSSFYHSGFDVGKE